MASSTSILAHASPSLLHELTRSWAPPPGAHIVAAVSGGGDSVALLHMLAALAPGRRWSISVATLDHGLRGAAGAADRAFVESLARELRIPVDSDARDARRGAGASPEAVARRVRREFLADAARARNASVVALGHTLDDQAETVIHRLARGAGLLGAGAMRRWRPPFWRPLLAVRRADLRRLLGDAGLAWCEDETNATGAGARHRIRREVTPALERALGAGALESFTRFAALAADDEDFLASAARAAAAGIVLRAEPDLVELDRRALASLPPALSRRILRDCLARLSRAGRGVGSVHLLALEALARATSPGVHADLPGRLTAQRRGRVLLLRRTPARDGDE